VEFVNAQLKNNGINHKLLVSVLVQALMFLEFAHAQELVYGIQVIQIVIVQLLIHGIQALASVSVLAL
jgi:hypothetical protein